MSCPFQSLATYCAIWLRPYGWKAFTVNYRSEALRYGHITISGIRIFALYPFSSTGVHSCDSDQ